MRAGKFEDLMSRVPRDRDQAVERKIEDQKTGRKSFRSIVSSRLPAMKTAAERNETRGEASRAKKSRYFREGISSARFEISKNW